MRLLLLPTLFLAGCCTPVQIKATLDTADLLKVAFAAEQANTNAFVASGNPAPAQMTAFTDAQRTAAAAFLKVYRAHVRHLLSMGEFDAAAVERIMGTINDL